MQSSEIQNQVKLLPAESAQWQKQKRGLMISYFWTGKCTQDGKEKELRPFAFGVSIATHIAEDNRAPLTLLVLPFKQLLPKSDHKPLH